MICRNCGNPIEPDSLFCTMCGARAETILPPEEAVARENAGVGMADVPGGFTQQSVPDMMSINEEKLPAASAGDRPATGAEEPEHNGFFGVGAFILCAVVIGLLSVSTGVFAALYFNAIGG